MSSFDSILGPMRGMGPPSRYVDDPGCSDTAQSSRISHHRSLPEQIAWSLHPARSAPLGVIVSAPRVAGAGRVIQAGIGR